MYKSKLQELCQRRSWELPEYATAKDGPDHMPRFSATVTVHGQVFETPAHCKSSKEAQNTAARVAFDSLTAPSPVTSSDPSPPLAGFTDAPLPVAPPPQIQPLSVAADPPPLLPLSPLPSSLPNPPLGLLATKSNATTKPSKEELLQENCDNTSQCPVDYKIAVGSECKDILHMYKNLLQQHAQKENLGFPVYTSEAEGPPHSRRFKSKVSINGKLYETPEFFSTLKEAEQTAAKIACQALSVDVIQEDKGLYKNLLQELAQKKGLMCPSYETVSSGFSHKPIFVSTVEIGSDSFQGCEAKTRKQAEMKAAEAAYYALTKGVPPTNSMNVSPMNTHPFADNLSQNIQPTATTEKQQNIQATATTEKHQVATDEDGPLNAKRAKSSPEDVDVTVNAHLHSNPPSHDTTSAEPVPEPTADNQPRWKTVVFPRKSNWPIPQNASVMPYSDDQWVAYRVELDQKPTAEIGSANLV
ncbi:double-stranded RNA-binding protein 1-like [Salvia miltiorrhiza]|uniref:double-stranded RNA-binding protein 1-like n=1 Tax=Salvia miltiorrhiza TaxID=226208 RepID=UPI0025ACBE02|nr:double-stranded RNA-binding protein 1-like [Salvia miltiorrhiza]